MDTHPDTTGSTDPVAPEPEALERLKRELREAETSLVTRIADVDDDRRLTTNRLQRAWQTHREEIDARLRRQASLFTGSLLGLALLLAAGLTLAYMQLDAARRALLDDVARLDAEYGRLAAVATQDQALEEGLAGLQASLAAISEALPDATEPPGATTPEPAPTPSGAGSSGAQPTPDARPAPAPAAGLEPGGDQGAPAPDTAVIKAAQDVATGSDAPGEGAFEASAAASSSAGGGPAPAKTPGVRIAEQPLLVGRSPFALQLIGFYSLDALLDFAGREKLPPRVYFREESYQGRPWFVLIHSLHARHADASRAIAELPPELSMLDTWIRSFSPDTKLGVLEIAP